jgi:hypothetical protein
MIILAFLLNISFAQEIIAIPNHGCPKPIGKYIFSKDERAFLKKFSPEIACSQKVSAEISIKIK